MIADGGDAAEPQRPATLPPMSAAKPWEHAKEGEGSGGDPLAARFVSSLDHDRRLYHHDIVGSLAHARMLHGAGLLSAEELTQIEAGLHQIHREIDEHGEDWSGWREELEDVHMCVEAALIERAGDAGRKLHTGRSRNDQVATDLLMWCHEATLDLQGLLEGVMRALVELAKWDGRVVMPSYTHLQRAQPIVAGGELLAWVAALDRARRRLGALWGVNRRNPLGSGAIAGSSLPLNRAATAEAMDLGPPTINSMDATANRDAALDMAYACSIIAMTLSRWAEQWVIYCSVEFGFVTLSGQHTTGSSMMPQKQNPDMLELIRGKCGSVYGSLVALLTMCKGITIGYNRDLQEDKRQLFAAYDTTRDCLDMAARVVAGARFNESRIAAGLDRGYLDATSLADYLVTRGVPFRSAHQVVGRLVAKCEAEGLESLAKIDVEGMNEAVRSVRGEDAPKEPAVGEDVFEWLGPANVVRRYQSEGNAGVSGFESQLAVWEQRLGAGPGQDGPAI